MCVYYFWEGPGIYSLESPTLDAIIRHMRNLGGDRSRWAVMVRCRQGTVNIPILPEWFY